MTTKQQMIRFNCFGEIVEVLPSPSFWPRAKGTIFELHKYHLDQKKPVAPIFVSLSAKVFRLYLAPIFDLGFVFILHVNSNVLRAAKKWVTDSILWEALLYSRHTTFLSNVFQFNDRYEHSEDKISHKVDIFLSNSFEGEKQNKLFNTFNDRSWSSVAVEIYIKGEHNLKKSSYKFYDDYFCKRCRNSHNNISDFKKCIVKETIILSHDEARNIEFHSAHKLTDEKKVMVMKKFLETYPQNAKIYRLVYGDEK